MPNFALNAGCSLAGMQVPACTSPHLCTYYQPGSEEHHTTTVLQVFLFCACCFLCSTLPLLLPSPPSSCPSQVLGERSVPCPALDLAGGFRAYFDAATNVTSNPPFDPFKNDINFLLASWSLEEIGATGDKVGAHLLRSVAGWCTPHTRLPMGGYKSGSSFQALE